MPPTPSAVRIQFCEAAKPIEETPKGSAILLKGLMESVGLPEIAKDLGMDKHHGMPMEEIVLVLLLFASYGVRSIAKLAEKAKQDQALAAVIEDIGKVNHKVLLYFEGCNEIETWERLLDRVMAPGQQHGRFRSEAKGILAIDDTALPKSGKNMEHITIIFDHATRQYVLGYVVVVISYADRKKAYPVNFEFRLLSPEEREQAEREREKKKAGIDLRHSGSLLRKVELEEEKGLRPEWVEVTGINLEAETLSKLDAKSLGWVAIPNRRTPLVDQKGNRWALDDLRAKALKNEGRTIDLEGWLLYRKRAELRGYGEVRFIVVTDAESRELGMFLLKPTQQLQRETELLQHFFRAREPADSNKLNIALRGVERAKKADIQSETASADAWYCVSWFITQLLRIPGIARFVSRLKSNYPVYYQGQWIEAKELWDRVKFRHVRDRFLRVATVTVQIKGLANPVKLVLFQELNKSLRVKAQYILLCTDATWPWQNILEAYKLRWTIEVFFRMAKQKYGLGSFHTKPFVKILAHVTFSVLCYWLCARLKLCNSRLQHLTLGQILDEYLNCLVTLERRNGCLVVYLDPAFVAAFGLPPDTS